jgi:hypothetical protein
VRVIVEHTKNQDVATTAQKIAESENDTLPREVCGVAEAIKTETHVAIILAFIFTIGSVVAFIMALFKR